MFGFSKCLVKGKRALQLISKSGSRQILVRKRKELYERCGY